MLDPVLSCSWAPLRTVPAWELKLRSVLMGGWAHMFEKYSRKQEEFAVFTVVNQIEFLRSWAVHNPAHTGRQTSSIHVVSAPHRNFRPLLFRNRDRHKEVNTTGGPALNIWHLKHGWAGEKKAVKYVCERYIRGREEKGLDRYLGEESGTLAPALVSQWYPARWREYSTQKKNFSQSDTTQLEYVCSSVWCTQVQPT